MRPLLCWVLSPALLVLALRGQASADPVEATPVAVIDVGADHWTKPWVPDLRAGKGERPIPIELRPDVLILGDGYLPDERSRFERDVEQWYAKFLTLTPWQQLRGAIRVRGYWTPSESRATAARTSHYQLNGTDPGEGTATRIHAALRAAGCNPAVRANQYSHATVILLIRDDKGRNPSGMTRGARDPATNVEVRVGYGAYTHHEFGHAYAGLRDEYIRGEDSRAIGRTPDRLSIFSLNNLSHRRDPDRVPWRHLMPGTAINPDPDSVIGVLWVGGGAEHGVWHSEGRCMMNGTHENWDFAKQKRGANLRDQEQFCFWCEEIIVAKTWARTGQFGKTSDGEAMYAAWEKDVRPQYQAMFRVRERIAERNARNKAAGWQDAALFERPALPAGR